jgi:hypothetical protein
VQKWCFDFVRQVERDGTRRGWRRRSGRHGVDEGEEENPNLEGEDNEDENGIVAEEAGLIIILTVLERKKP